jgi:hypothetical protein
MTKMMAKSPITQIRDWQGTNDGILIFEKNCIMKSKEKYIGSQEIQE